jgi:hypothetical protein
LEFNRILGRAAVGALLLRSANARPFVVDDTAKVSKSISQILAPRRRHFYLQVSRRFSRWGEIMKTVADQFAETLAAAGVKRIHCIVGDSLNGLAD